MDFAVVVARKDEIVRQWREGVEKKIVKAGEKLTLVRGHARFVGPREIEVESGRPKAQHARSRL